MMSVEQIKVMDRATNPHKFLPSTIAFMREMRAIANDGRERRGQKTIQWTEKDEVRY